MKNVLPYVFFFCFLMGSSVLHAQENMTSIANSVSNSVIGNGAFNFQMPPCSPAATNNNYANAITLTVGAAAINGTTCQGTIEAGEALGCNTAATQTVWYRFTSTAAISYLIIDATGSTCYLGSSVWPGFSLPTNRCTMIDCQSADYGPTVTVFKLTAVAGTNYSVQITYTSGLGCGNHGSFTIRVANAYAGTISNPGSTNTCATPSPGCYFLAPPTVPTVTGTCTGYPLITQTNLVNNYFVQFTTAAMNSIQLSFQDIIQSTCVGGNVDWFFYRLFDTSCNLLTCGDLGNLQNNVACNTTYVLEYMWEELPCSYTTQWPYQYIPTGTVGCGTLPVELINFDAKVENKNVSLQWITASETENDFFTIERSSDATKFSKIKCVKGNGNSTEMLTYSATDELPAPGIYYYRLEQTDFNGSYTYSPVISVNSDWKHALVIIQQPDENSINLIYPLSADAAYHCSVYDSKGASVFSTMLIAGMNSNESKLDVSSLSPGLYHCVLVSGSELLQQKFFRK